MVFFFKLLLQSHCAANGIGQKAVAVEKNTQGVKK